MFNKLKICKICGKELSFIEKKWEIADGIICNNCKKPLLSIGLEYPSDLRDKTLSQINELKKRDTIMTQEIKKLSKFTPTRSIETLYIDDNKKLWYCGKSPEFYSHYYYSSHKELSIPIIYSFDEIIDVNVATGKTETYESSNYRLSNQNRVYTYTQTNYKLLIVVNTYTTYTLTVPCYDHSAALQMCSALEQIINQQKAISMPIEPPSMPIESPPDEIRKYKELLDDGIITQDEFNAKKKQLLGL